MSILREKNWALTAIAYPVVNDKMLGIKYGTFLDG